MLVTDHNVMRACMKVAIVGHVDHGKSTVAGRLLADGGFLPDGKIEAIRRHCERNAKPFEYAFLLDAFKEERAQGITIDTARAFLKTHARQYMLIDTPGHVEFLKNMVTGAARADAALLVVDAKEGVQENTRRHAYLLGVLAIRQIIVLVNKMDVVGYDQASFEETAAACRAALQDAGSVCAQVIPVSGREGDNIVGCSRHMAWYEGSTVLEGLESFKDSPVSSGGPFRMPVQGVYKFSESGNSRRIVAGTPESGQLNAGDAVVFYPSGKTGVVDAVEVYPPSENASMTAGVPGGFTLKEQIYISRGEVAARVSERVPEVSSLFQARIFWMGREPLQTEKTYDLKIGTARTPMRVEKILGVINAATLAVDTQKRTVARHEAAQVLVRTRRPVVFDCDPQNSSSARFVLVDGYEIAGGGVIGQNCENRNTASISVCAPQEARLADLSRTTLWLVGRPCSGKTTLARALKIELERRGVRSVHLDADDVRQTLNADLGFSLKDREENLRRAAHVARMFNDNGLCVLASFVSPTESCRAMVQDIIGRCRIISVRCSPEVCETRDVKGMYVKARQGKIRDFTGVSAAFEEPLLADVVADTEYDDEATCIARILSKLGF